MTPQQLIHCVMLGLSWTEFFFFLAENKGVWLNGFFDRGSFVETLDGWAKTVVCGRAR